MQRMNRSVERAWANAAATWSGGEPFGVLLDHVKDEGFMGDVVTAVRQEVSLCVANAPGIAEGGNGLRINGQECTVLGAVVADASGWATFPVQLNGGN